MSNQQDELARTCFNCKHAYSWDYAGGLYEPPDNGWDCGYRTNYPLFNEVHEHLLDYEDKHGMIQEDAAVGCPGYFYQEPQALEDYKPLTQEEIAAIEEARLKAEEERFIELGWVNPNTGELTDEYYRMADIAYDMYKGK